MSVQIDCKTELSTPINGFDLKLTLRYENNNAVPIFVPLGGLNQITPPSASYEVLLPSVTLPELFLADTVVYFDILVGAGNAKWELETFGCLSKSRTGSESKSLFFSNSCT